MAWGSSTLQVPSLDPSRSEFFGAGGGLTSIGLSVDIYIADGVAIVVHSKGELHLFCTVRLRAAEPEPGPPTPEAGTRASASGPVLEAGIWQGN